MFMQKPIIASISGETKKIINDAKCGYAGEAEDVESLIKNIKDFIKLTENEKKKNGIKCKRICGKAF